MGSIPLYAAEFTWDGGGDGVTWADAANWGGGGFPAAGDTAIFPDGVPANIVLAAGTAADTILVDGSAYTFSNNNLILSGNANVDVNFAESTTINSTVEGSDGLRKTGGGTLRLTGNNTYTGTTNIDDGTILITGQDGLGADTSAVNVNGSSTRGFLAGSLVLDGSAGDISFTRDLNLRGRGPITDRGSSLISFGNNTISSDVARSVGGTNDRVTAVTGTLSFNGTTDTSGGSVGTFAAFGGTNDVSIGNYNLTGVLTGDGSIEKSGAGRLLWNPSDASGFSGRLRVSTGSFAEGSVRIISDNVLGTRTGVGSGSSALDINSGVLEFRMDNPTANAGGSPANVYQRANATIVVDNAPNDTTTALGGTLTLGEWAFDDGRDFNVDGRNGYNLTITGEHREVGGNSQVQEIRNRLEGGGLLTFSGNVWNTPDNGLRDLEFDNDGDTLIMGSIVTTGTGADQKNVDKNGIGTLTIRGTNTTAQGILDINRGTVAITDFRSIGTTSSANITMGDGAGSGSNGVSTLQIGGEFTDTPTAGGLITNRAIDISGSGDIVLRAVHTTNDPIVINGNITTTQTTNKDVVLAGTNEADNVINGEISNGVASNNRLWKIGSGTWVLGGNNTYTGETRIDNGILKARASDASSNIIADTSEIRFVTIGNRPGPGQTLNNESQQYGGGTFEYVGANGINSTEVVGNLDADDGSNTIRVTPGVGGNATLVFASIDEPNNDTSINFEAPIGTGNISFANYTGSTTDIFNAGVYFNGSDFAFITGDNTAVRAANYGGDAGFVSIGSGNLTANAHNNTIGNINQTGAEIIKSLRIDGSTTDTITLGGLLTIRDNGSNGNDGGVLLTGGNATITGSAIGTGTGATASTGDFYVRVEGKDNTLTIDSNVNGNTDGSLIKSGAGTLIVGGTFANAGSNAINEGLVRIGAGGSLANRNLFVGQNATLNLNGTDVNARAFNLNGNIVNTSSANVTLTIGNSQGGGVSAGNIQETDGQISVVKNSEGNMSLDGLNTYTGSTTIGGFVNADDVTNSRRAELTIHEFADIGEASGLGRGDATNDATNAASLIFTGTTNQGAARLPGISYDGWDAVSTNRLFTFGANSTTNTNGASIESNGVNQANIVFSNTGALAFTTAAQAANQTLRLGGTSIGDNVFLPQITDPGGTGTGGTGIRTSVFKDEAGVWSLSGNNTYTGTTTINGGRLVDAGGLPIGSGLNIVNGQLLKSGTFTRDLVTNLTPGNSNEVTFSGGANNNRGFGAAEGDLTVTLSGGAQLTWGAGGFIPDGSGFRLNNVESNGKVDFTNDIDLGAATRTVFVTNNGHTAGDYAVLSGDLSGIGGNLNFNGGGILQLTGDNSYTGSTTITNGELFVSSLGSTSGGPTSSVGASGVADVATIGSAVILAGTGNSPATLVYTGAGEVSDRYISIALGTGGGNNNRDARIYASGTGALVLENLNFDSSTATRNLFLRGNNTDNNMITSDLSQTNGLTIDGGASWILSGNNTYTGTTSLNAGAAGIGSNTAFGTSTLSFNNGIMFAYGADRTLSNNVQIDNNTTMGFRGDHSITFTDATVVWSNNNNNGGFNNNIDNTNGASLTFTGDMTWNAINATRTFQINGAGDTNINGNITTNTGENLNFTKTGSGTLTLGGEANDFSGGNFIIDNGTVVATAANIASSSARLELSPENSASETATFDVNGNDQTVNELRFASSGDNTITNTSSTAATLTFGANNAAYTDNSTGGVTYTGNLSLVKIGTTNATILTDTVLTHTGSTAVNGGNLTILAPLQQTTGLIADNGGTLSVTGGLTNPGSITTVTVDNGATLDLVNGVGDKLSTITTLTLGTGADMTLSLEAGDVAVLNDNLGSDTLTTGGAASTGNIVTINITDNGLAAGGNYTLLSAGSGLSGATYQLGTTPGGFSGITLDTSDTFVRIDVGSVVSGNLFWDAGSTGAWNVASNFSTDKAGASAATVKAGAENDIIFTSDDVSNAAVTTTLEEDFRINSLTFEDSATTQSNFTIATGTGSNRLDINPNASSDGIAVVTSGASDVLISTELMTSADQTWTIANSGSSLELSGGLSGESDVTIGGNGTVRITSLATPDYNAGGTADFTVGDNSTLIISDANALAGASNAAGITINTGGAFFTEASTPMNDIVLNGGTLSVDDAANRTYGGDVTVAADSTINLRRNNDSDPTANRRDITLSGNLSGTATLNVESSQTDGDSLNDDGNLILLGDLSGFTGNTTLNGGRILYRNNGSAGAQTTGDISVVEGDLEWEGVGGDGYTLNREITIVDRGELRVERSSGTGNFTLDFADTIQTASNFNGSSIILEGNSGAVANVNGNLTQSTGTRTDVQVSGATWNFNSNATIRDDLTVTTADAVLNLNVANGLTFGGSNNATLNITNNAIVNLGADNVSGTSLTNLDRLFVGQGGANIGTLNTNGFDIVAGRFDLGNRYGGDGAPNRVGIVTGNGTIRSNDFNLRAGNISAGFDTNNNAIITKDGAGQVVISGNNSLWDATGDFDIITGSVILDYTNDNSTKLSSAGASDIDMRGTTLIINGSSTAATSQDTFRLVMTDANQTTGTEGSNIVRVISNNGQDAVLNFTTVSRNKSDGVVRFDLPTGTQSATNGITTTQGTALGGRLANGNRLYAIARDAGGNTSFAAVTGGDNIVLAATNDKDDVSTWTLNDHISDVNGFNNDVIESSSIRSLRFNATTANSVMVSSSGALGIAGGGILVTDKVTGGTPGINDGTLFAQGEEIIIHQESNQAFTLGSDLRANTALTVSGGGVVNFTGESTGTGFTSVYRGTLNANADSLSPFSRLIIAQNQDSIDKNAIVNLLGDQVILELVGGREDGTADGNREAFGVLNLNDNTLYVRQTGTGGRSFAGQFLGNGNLIFGNGDKVQSLFGQSDAFTGNIIADSAVIMDVRARARNAASWTINKGGSLTLEKVGGTREGTMIGNDAPVFLNSADGTRGVGAIIRGFGIDTDQTSNNGENIGVLTANTGASYVTLDARDGDSDPLLQSNDLVRNNDATISLVGTNLGATSGGQRGRYLIDNAQEDAFYANNAIGGNGSAGTATLSIIPWMIGEDVGAERIGADNVGNSLVTYDNTHGFRPLDFATEYSTFAGAGGATDNVRQSLGGNLTGLTTQTVNSLVIDNTGVSGLEVLGGAGQTLTNTSGAFLFTSVAGASGPSDQAYDTTLGGFDGIAVGGDYTFFVANPGSGVSPTKPNVTTTAGSNQVTLPNNQAGGLEIGMYFHDGGTNIPTNAQITAINTGGNPEVITLSVNATASGTVTAGVNAASTLAATITSPLTTAGNIVKSGQGSLTLSGLNNTAGGNTNRTTVNEGTLSIDDLDNIGGNSGRLVLAGGTLSLEAGFTDDLSDRTLEYLSGGSVLDYGSNALTFNNSMGTGVGDLTVTGAGSLTLNATSTRSGLTNISGTTVTLGADNALGTGDINLDGGSTLNLGSNNQTTGRFTATSNVNKTVNGTGTITANDGYYFDHTGNTLTINATLAGSGGLFKDNRNSNLTINSTNNNYSGQTIFRRGTLAYQTIGNVSGGASSLGAPTSAEEGTIRLGIGSQAVNFRKIGSTSSESDRIIALQATTGAVNIENDSGGGADLHLGVIRNEAYGTKTLTLRGTSTGASSVAAIEQTAGTVNLVKSETNTWTINGDSNYTGTTTINAGTLVINGDNSAATGAVTVTNTATLGGSGTIGGAINVQSGGTLSPGTSPGVMTTNDLTLETGSTFVWDLIANTSTDNGGGRGTLFDGVDLNDSSTFTIETGVNFNIVANGTDSTVDYTYIGGASDFWITDREWLIFSYNSITTDFQAGSIFNTPTISNDSLSQSFNRGGSFSFSTTGGVSGGTDGLYLNFTAVPEPSTYALMGLGLAAFGWFARRRRRQACDAVDSE